MKFKREKVDTLMGHTEARYTEDSPDPRAKIIASHSGVTMVGEFKIESHGELDEFARVITDAWKDHLALKPKLTKTVTGH